VKPTANGPHLAVVIGPNDLEELDTSKQDIFADSMGRVRVRFPWDKSNFQLSQVRPAAWVRVSEGWAGRQFGTQFLPRIGQEVIVDFIDGDPDRPIITGRVYNADRGAANIPFPEGQVERKKVDLDDWLEPIGFTDFRFSGIKTSSTPKPSKGAKARYHLARYDDAYNCEQYLLRSQGRLDVTAFAHSFETTYGNRNVKVVPGEDKDGKPFGGSSLTTIGGESDLHIGGSHYAAVDKDYQLTVKGDTSLHVMGDLKAVVGGVASMGAGSIVLEATNKITLKVGSSWIVVTPCGVYASGPMIYKNSGGGPDSASPVTMVDVADAATAEPGDQPNKRTTDCNPHGGHGRKRSSHTYEIQPAPPCYLDDERKICVDPLVGPTSQGVRQQENEGRSIDDAPLSGQRSTDQGP
jgi:type VI secretion system secreted protein VgrG